MTAFDLKRFDGQRRAEIARFLAVGATVYVVYIGTYAAAHAALPAVAAMTLAYCLAVSLHYWLSRTFTFRAGAASSSRIAREVPRYALLLALSYILNLLVFALGRTVGAADIVSLTAGILANTAVTFILCRYWIFRAVA
jgi:putative flippase GtrA